MIERKVFKTRTFARWTSKISISDADLLAAVEELSRGLIDAQLGSFLIKKRVAVNNKGKRSGGRTLIATNLKNRWVFLYGFGKNEKGNINQAELAALRELAKIVIGLEETQVQIAVNSGELIKVKHDAETKKQNPKGGAGISGRPAEGGPHQQT